MLDSLDWVTVGTSVRVIAGIDRAPTWEEFKSNPSLGWGDFQIAVTALVKRVKIVLVHVNPTTGAPTNLEMDRTTVRKLITRGRYKNCAWVPSSPNIVRMPTCHYPTAPRKEPT